MSWQDEVRLVPSRNRGLLESLLGRRIERLCHYLDEPVEELLRGHAYGVRDVQRHELFRVAGGPVVIHLDDGNEIGIAHSEELISVTIERAEDAGFDDADWKGRIEATDGDLAEPCFANAIGKVISGIHVVQLEMPNANAPTEIATSIGRRVLSSNAVDRPREVALVLNLDENGMQLVFSSTLFDAPNNFAVTTDLNGVEVPLKEILQLRAKR